jgi:hypothetical protein
MPTFFRHLDAILPWAGSKMAPKMDVTWTYCGGRFKAALTGKRNSCSRPQIYQFDPSRRDAENARDE